MDSGGVASAAVAQQSLVASELPQHMSQSLIILGTGGSVYDVLDIVDAFNAITPTWRVAGFLDDLRPAGSTYLGLPILGSILDARRFSVGHRFINTIGSDTSFRRRPELIASTGLANDNFATLVHPHASVSSRARLGSGIYICHGVSIGGAVQVCDHVSLSPGVIVGHDSVIERFAVLAPGALISGHVRLGPACYVGAGASVRQRVCVGTLALIGMGAVVLHDVPADTTVVGNPARTLVRRASTPLMAELSHPGVRSAAVAEGAAS